jgi:hypothetical protein
MVSWVEQIGKNLIKKITIEFADTKVQSINLGDGKYKDIYYLEGKIYKIVYLTNFVVTNVILIDNTMCNKCNKKSNQLIYCEDCEKFICDYCNVYFHFSHNFKLLLDKQ